VNEQLSAGDILEPFVACCMVEVAMRVDDVHALQPIPGKGYQDLVHISAGIDHCGLPGPFTS
jgi:hypothetical protein